MAVPVAGHGSITTQQTIMAHGIEMSYQLGNQQVPVLKDVSLSVNSGKIKLLMGPSGSGKTTLLSILAGLLSPTGGSVELLGQNITKLSRTQLSRFRLEHIGFIFQGFNLFPALTAIENVELALDLRGVRGKVARDQSRDMLEHVGLGDKLNHHPRDLSGGQKQRVAIARALVARPKIVMADEPTAALDSHSGHAVMELLRNLAKEEGVTVLMVTHDPRIVDIADSTICLEDGEIQTTSVCGPTSPPI
jgi:putative ABC transport system ATP-binding protein